MLDSLVTHINDRYGSKRAFLRHGKYYCLHRLGYMRDLYRVDFERVDTLVLVCSGNICRSAFAEYYARHLGMNAESYGLHCRGGDPADPRIRELARGLGIDMSEHRSRPIRQYRPRRGHLVVAMEAEQVATLKDRVVTAQMTLLPAWASPPSFYLHDPFAASGRYLDQCAGTLMSVLNTLRERMDALTDNR